MPAACVLKGCSPRDRTQKCVPEGCPRFQADYGAACLFIPTNALLKYLQQCQAANQPCSLAQIADRFDVPEWAAALRLEFFLPRLAALAAAEKEP